ncbi:MAG: hypothetical protein A4E48_00318 [Methanosaeta sp. PtaU1.Bin060]|nr:MAG: hypothetical protein A4E45_02086 [Methanosaeta sp. PtaB.Bin039]OPY54490.1 MAG: hypothetical protein A4E48_00318 [Methanosaeta sp. PtaU1.Bin060]
MRENPTDHTRNLKRDRILTEKERARLINRKEDPKRSINDARVRRKLSNWLKTLDEAFLILNHLPSDQSWDIITNEDVLELLCLAGRAMRIKSYFPVFGEANDPFAWETDIDKCEPLDVERCNSELYKVKFGGITAQGRSGAFRFDMQLLDILRTGDAIDINDLLMKLKLDPNNSDVVAIIEEQISHLQKYGLVRKVENSWQWVGPKESEKS